jgi:hypothetical protein
MCQYFALLNHKQNSVCRQSKMPANDLKELIAWLKANPKRASAGISSSGFRLLTVLFQKETGTQFTLVPSGPHYEQFMRPTGAFKVADILIVPKAIPAGACELPENHHGAWPRITSHRTPNSWLMRQWASGSAAEAEADRAYKLRKKEREKTREIISTPDPVKAMAVAIGETIVAAVPFERREVTEAREKLLRAARGHVDLAADVSPIFALIDQG